MSQSHEEIEAIAEARVFALAAPVVLPLIERREKDALGRLIQAHRAGRTETQTIVAEITVLAELKNEIRQKQLTYQELEEKHGNAKRI